MNTFSENFSISAGWRKKNNKLFRYFGTVIAFLFFIAIFSFLAPGIKNSFYLVSSPVEKAFWAAGESSSGFAGSFFKAGSLVKENDNLKSENQRLISQIVSLQAINNANQAQSDVSISCQNTDFKLLMAGVIGMDGQDIVSINKGSEDGVLKGMPVISQQNVVFGEIGKVYKNFSEVMLISNKKSVINVRLEQNQNAKEPAEPIAEIDGLVRGGGNMGIYLDLVTVDNNINEGDILITSSLEKTFPKDLLVGKVVKIQKNDQKPFQQAEVKPFFDLNGLDNLFVITNYKR